MKKVINYILGILLTAGMSSCGTDWLDLTPEYSVATSEALSTEEGLQTALNGAYRQLGEHWFYGDRIVMYPELKGEDIQCVSTSSRGYPYYSFTQTSGDQEILETWKSGYQLIHYVNNIIKAIDTDFNTSDSNIAEIRSEALALRALAVFQMTNMYGNAYTISSSSPGIPLISVDESIDYKPARSTVAECYTQVVNDLKDALPALPTSKTNGYINKWAAEGILSRVYLYMGEYANALTYAKDIIDNSPYLLSTNEAYATMWGSSFPDESIFEIYYDDAENVGSDCLQGIYNWDGYAGMVLTDEYLDLLNEDEDDVRHCFAQTGDNSIYTVEGTDTTHYAAWLTKYPGDGTVYAPSNVQYNNFYLLRLSEIYLTAAECDFRENGTSGDALSYMNAIVNRANPLKMLSESDLNVDRILEERKRELVGEGICGLYDILRTRGASGTISHSGDRHIPTLNYKTVNCSDDRVTAPIPSEEIVNNGNIKQNPGYSN